MRKELDREGSPHISVNASSPHMHCCSARQQQHEKLRLETEKKKQADAAFQEWMREVGAVVALLLA